MMFDKLRTEDINLSDFFTKAFESAADKEAMYKSIIMNADSEEAAELRRQYYATQFKSMGENVQIGAGVKIVNPQFISVGDNVRINDGTTLIARGEGGITLGNNVWLNERVYLDTEHDDGYINIKDKVYIGTGTTLFGHKGLEIGEYCLLAQNITITPYSHIFENPDEEIIKQGGHTRKVTIGRDSYIGMNVCVLYSADIGEGSVVGSGAVVVKTLPPYSVAVGNPARVIRSRKK